MKKVVAATKFTS